MSLVFIPVPVVGNFSDEDVNGVPQDSLDNSSLQRDEVPSTKKGVNDRNFPQGIDWNRFLSAYIAF